ncbi:uncharacterized protein LOC113463600 isoform X1 [Phoenix dactylifera]|uniref:Uncharacterized protein LOC113463600 isoform X1 n=1 Tax=Phoenix dactylifera TaxID=42345 RepID=A0A8B8ZGT4_PHODC|nr:uncharacterized protein LOC113463600 isoform X1 [Phoenix dactylifera]
MKSPVLSALEEINDKLGKICVRFDSLEKHEDMNSPSISNNLRNRYHHFSYDRAYPRGYQEKPYHLGFNRHHMTRPHETPSLSFSSLRSEFRQTSRPRTVLAAPNCPPPVSSQPREKSKNYSTLVEKPKICSSKVRCLNCTGEGHFASQCPSELLNLGVTEKEHPEEIYIADLDLTEAYDEPSPIKEVQLEPKVINLECTPAQPKENINWPSIIISNTFIGLEIDLRRIFIDRGSFTHVVSAILKDGLIAVDHPSPYTITWLETALIPRHHSFKRVYFQSYEEDVPHDVPPRNVASITLGRYNQNANGNDHLKFSGKKYDPGLYSPIPLSDYPWKHIRFAKYVKKTLWHLLGVKWKFSSAYLPQTDG